MVSFFAIFSILVLVNAVLLFASSIDTRKRITGASFPGRKKTDTRVYPIDLKQSKYKKAI